jgi:Protein of unknown function (DUF1403)
VGARRKTFGKSSRSRAFLAGAALARLDAVMRDNPPFAGALRKRLALRAAAACVAHSGRAEDEGALRDAVQFTGADADCGPAGRTLLAWRALTTGSTGQWRGAILRAAEALAIPQSEALHAAIAAADTCTGGPEAAPFAAAKTFALAKSALTAGPMQKLGGRGGVGAVIGAWLADCVLAQKLHWPFAVPLLGVALFAGSARGAASDAGEGDQTTRILSAFAHAAAQACDLAAEFGRRAQKLHDAAPNLRAKGAGAAIASLLDDVV